MSRVTILGIIWVFIVVATVVGLSVYGALIGSDPLAFLKNASGALLISGSIMFGSVLMVLGGILNNSKYQREFSPKKQEVKIEQREYLQQLLGRDDLSPEERKSIEKKLKGL